MRRICLIIITALALLGVSVTNAQQNGGKDAKSKAESSSTGPKELVMEKVDTLEISLAQADVTIASQQAALMEKELSSLSKRLQEQKTKVQELEDQRKQLVKEKFLKAGIPEKDLENWAGSTNDKGQLVLKRQESKK